VSALSNLETKGDLKRAIDINSNYRRENLITASDTSVSSSHQNGTVIKSKRVSEKFDITSGMELKDGKGGLSSHQVLLGFICEILT
jgi:hypothetical protein